MAGIKVHGIDLAANSYIDNLNVGTVTAANAITESTATAADVGKIWVEENSEGEKSFKMVTIEEGSSTATVATFTSQEKLDVAISSYNSKLIAATGSGLVGFSGVAAADGVTIPTGTVQGAIGTLASKLKLAQESANGDLSSFTDNLLSTDLDDDTKGSSLIGYEGYSSAHIELPAGTVEDTIHTLAGLVNTEIADTDVRQLDKTSTDADSIAASTLTVEEVVANQGMSVDKDLTVGGSTVITGDLTVNGTTTTVNSTEVAIKDNVVVLNAGGDTSEDVLKAASFGWAVERGEATPTQVVNWDENELSINALTQWTKEGFHALDAEDGTYFAGDADGSSEVIAGEDQVIVAAQFDHQNAKVDASLVGLKTKVGNSIGELPSLTTDTKENLVASINEVDANADTAQKTADDNKVELASQDADKGSSIVGFIGQTGTNGQMTVAAGTVEASLKAVINEIDADKQSAEARITLEASTTASEGSALVGFSGKTDAVNGNYTVAAGTVESAITSVVVAIDADRKVEADRTATVDGKFGQLVSSINNGRIVLPTTAAATTHTLDHGFGTTEVNATVLVKDSNGSYKNTLVGMEITESSVILTGTEAFEAKVFVESFADVDATFSIA